MGARCAMSEIGVRPNQSAIRSRAGVMTAAALFYLSGAMETEAEPAAGDQNTTEQAPTPAPQQSAPAQSPSTRQTPSGAAPEQTEQKSDTLPTVSVQARRPRAPAAVRAAPPSRPVAAPPRARVAPPPSAAPAGRDEPGRMGRNPPAARTDPLSGHQYRHHATA